jgi:hypothetical protein
MTQRRSPSATILSHARDSRRLVESSAITSLGCHAIADDEIVVHLDRRIESVPATIEALDPERISIRELMRQLPKPAPACIDRTIARLCER